MSIRVLNLTSGTEVGISSFVFSGGEVQVKVNANNGLHNAESLKIEATITKSDDIMELLLVTDALRRITGCPKDIYLELKYVPYARQDRVMNHGESLSIKVFCDLINSQNYTKVTIWDPHSDVTPALLNNCTVVSQALILNSRLPLGLPRYETRNMADINNLLAKFRENTVLVSPDAGATKKILDAAKLLGIKDVVQASKVRDTTTGAITGTVVHSEHIGNKDFLIVDDIIDGGFTFTELAKVLRPLTNGKIILYVTHGIFSKGLRVFEGLIDEVYCANSFGKFEENVNLMSTIKQGITCIKF
jgi:ribose-phosphate pyrophosphokinase